MGHPYPPHGRDPVAAAAEQFKLDDRQVAALEALRQRLAERRSESRGQRDGFQALTIDAMRQPALDRAALSGALEQRRESTGDLILDITQDLNVFLDGLTSEQTAAFLDRAERARDFLGRESDVEGKGVS